MPEYDPLILRDQLIGQIEHARHLIAARLHHEALDGLLDYLDNVVEDINHWDQANA